MRGLAAMNIKLTELRNNTVKQKFDTRLAAVQQIYREWHTSNQNIVRQLVSAYLCQLVSFTLAADFAL